jgi:hypothetical protein
MKSFAWAVIAGFLLASSPVKASEAKTMSYQLREDAVLMETLITAAIEHVNDKQHTVDYGKTRQRVDRLAAKLEVPNSR